MSKEELEPRLSGQGVLTGFQSWSLTEWETLEPVSRKNCWHLLTGAESLYLEEPGRQRQGIGSRRVPGPLAMSKRDMRT